MAKREDFNEDSDNFDELDVEHHPQPPKKAKKEKHDEGVSPDTKPKPGRGAYCRGAWTKEEEQDFLDCLQTVVAANISQAIKDYPRLAARKSSGCHMHWNAMRRRLDVAVLGVATIDKNGKKIEIADRVKPHPSKPK